MRTTVLYFLAAVSILGPTASAQLSREELVEHVERGTTTEEIAALVERVCVDFELDSRTLLDLAASIPRVVLDAAIACTNRPDPEIGCQIYTAMADDPALAEFPAVITNLHDSRVDLMVLESGVWIEEKGIGLRGTFKAIRQHTAMVERVEDLALSVSGVSRVIITRSTTTSVATLTRTQQRGIVAACSTKSRVTISTEPTGATVWIDRKRRGKTPLELSMPGGDYALSLVKRGFVDHREELSLDDGVSRSVTVTLESIPKVSITSEPSQAVVVIDGRVVGRTPLEVPIAEGPHELEVIKPLHAPLRTSITGKPGEIATVDAHLDALPRNRYCYPTTVQGGLEGGFEALRAALVSSRMRSVVPLYQVVTSTMESKLASTHVVDGDLLLFAPRRNDNYVDRPSQLVGRELGGIAFGETAQSLLKTPPGVMIVTAVERKKASIKVELLAESGQRNALFIDFTRPPKQVSAQEALDAMCVVFSQYPGFEAPFPTEP